MVTVLIKPLSVNEAWQGQRVKTKAYRDYENKLINVHLPNVTLPKPPFEVFYEFGFSDSRSDIDNPVKPLQDILQKKYGFNDSQIFKATIQKFKVEKGFEYLAFNIISFK